MNSLGHLCGLVTYRQDVKLFTNKDAEKVLSSDCEEFAAGFIWGKDEDTSSQL